MSYKRRAAERDRSHGRHSITPEPRQSSLRRASRNEPPGRVVIPGHQGRRVAAGDEAVSALTQFARSEQLEAAQITAVGAFEQRGGHLLEGRVFPTLEAVVTETPARLRKVMRPDIGIALIDLDQSEA